MRLSAYMALILQQERSRSLYLSLYEKLELTFTTRIHSFQSVKSLLVHVSSIGVKVLILVTGTRPKISAEAIEVLFFALLLLDLE